MPPDPTTALLPVLAPYPKLAGLLTLWKDRLGERLMPARQELDALNLRPWLGHLHVIEVIGDDRYRYRIFGTTIGQLLQRDLQNREAQDLPEPERSETIEDYRHVVRSRAPKFVERHRKIADKYNVEPRIRPVGKLCLPLSDDGTNVSQILAALYPRPE